MEADACDMYVVCVPTPASPGGGFDLSYIRVAVLEVAAVLASRRFATVVVRSTMLPGTMRNVVLPMLESHSGTHLSKGFGLCYNPEFLRAATALDDFMSPPLIVVGEFDAKSAELVAELYRPFGAPELRTTPENAEAIKCFSNAFNATKISFFNLLFLAGRRAGIDAEVVADAMTVATTAIRFPDYGTPGGRPYEGACLPKDTAASIAYLEQLGVDTSLLSAVIRVNELMAENASISLWRSG